MYRYFATFPAGTFDIIRKHLKSFSLAELKIIEHDDSSVVFDSSMSVERLIEIRYFTNIYAVLDGRKSLPSMNRTGKFFRLMYLKGGSPQALPDSERARLETQIRETFHVSPNTHQATYDFVVIERTAGAKMLTIRLPRVKFKRDDLEAGELRPELAHILCLAAGVKAKQIVLDPFAGHGAIPIEAVRGFGCKHVIAVDSQRQKHHESSVIEWRTGDAQHLSFIKDDSIDRVVTDPPWGIFKGESYDIATLYAGFAKELVRILKPDGIAVILSSYADVETAFTHPELIQIAAWPVLISGKKATIYKLQKIRRSGVSGGVIQNSLY